MLYAFPEFGFLSGSIRSAQLDAAAVCRSASGTLLKLCGLGNHEHLQNHHFHQLSVSPTPAAEGLGGDIAVIHLAQVGTEWFNEDGNKEDSWPSQSPAINPSVGVEEVLLHIITTTIINKAHGDISELTR